MYISLCSILRYILFYMLFFVTLYAKNTDNEQMQKKEIALGEMLFFDTILSRNKIQSCASCHNPDHAFIDSRDSVVGGAASLGDDNKSIGDRNAPTAAYAMFSPRFHYDKKKKHYIGGQFLDGREPDLKGQASGPPMNPVEMNMPSIKSIAKRLEESKIYNMMFREIYGKDIFNDSNKTYKMMAQSIGKFETTKEFRAFDSKYDRFLEGKYDLTVLEDLGRSLFFSNNNTNCASCHMNKTEDAPRETFTNYQYHNIGVPPNHDLMAKNVVDAKTFIDHGLMQHPDIKKLKNAQEYDGKFRVPTLRNIAVTGPYMHNGVFKDLRTVVEFYDMYLNKQRNINRETGKPWLNAEVKVGIEDKKLLMGGKRLSDRKIEALVAFMKLLTDKRYEHLLEEEK